MAIALSALKGVSPPANVPLTIYIDSRPKEEMGHCPLVQQIAIRNSQGAELLYLYDI